MRFLTSYQTKNRCYQKATKAAQVGIMVHSTGAVNTECRRYVDYEEELGKNQYNNHWNQASADKCMHGFIGLDKNGDICYVNTLPYTSACWGCGGGSKGSMNYNPQAHIQFEICEGSKTNQEYYQKAIEAAEIVCATLCKKYGWSANRITSHKEGHDAGYASNHGDPQSYMANFGDNMVKFRERVQARLDGAAADEPEAPTETESEPYEPETEPVTAGKIDTVEEVQVWANNKLSAGIYPDGLYGSATQSAIVKGIQAELGVNVDGIFGPVTKAAIINLRQGDSGNLVMMLQALLVCNGYPGAYVDGKFGGGTRAAVRSYQSKHGLAIDGVAGKNTFAALCS